MTTYYMSFNDLDIFSAEPDSVGTSSTATDLVEIRLGTAGTNVTQRQALIAIERAERWIMSNGLTGLGANLPPDRG